MKVDAPDLVAAAQRLRSAAEQLATSGPTVHPPLAADETSAAAAGRLTATAVGLAAAADARAAALNATADRLGILAPPSAPDADKKVAADKKIVAPTARHTESVTGRVMAGRLQTHAEVT